MKVVYSRQALADLEQIANYYSSHTSPSVADSIRQRFLDVIERIRHAPEMAPRVTQRRDIRVVPGIRYPFQIFYRVRGGGIDILHIRHTSRRPPDLSRME